MAMHYDMKTARGVLEYIGDFVFATCRRTYPDAVAYDTDDAETQYSALNDGFVAKPYAALSEEEKAILVELVLVRYGDERGEAILERLEYSGLALRSVEDRAARLTTATEVNSYIRSRSDFDSNHYDGWPDSYLFLGEGCPWEGLSDEEILRLSELLEDALHSSMASEYTVDGLDLDDLRRRLRQLHEKRNTRPGDRTAAGGAASGKGRTTETPAAGLRRQLAERDAALESLAATISEMAKAHEERAAALSDEAARLTAAVDELTARFGQGPHDYSKPRSSDGPGPASKSKPRRWGRKPRA
ncbi:MAG: hypothetical protein LBJ02_03545 [Bifidobacteriaceae bacterium]|jgi:hypothetical protein|nr:hypothetical protein [Bifidobacteriaceae bacterium]